MSTPAWLDHVGRYTMRLLRYQSRWVDTAVGPVHVFSRAGAGELPPVLLVHGFGAAAMHWAPLVRALRPHVRSVHAIDLPGHGFSHRPSALTLDILREGVVEALDRLDLPPAVLVGNSLGGAVAVRYRNARPDRVLGTHLMSPGGAPMTVVELDEVRRLFRVRTTDEARVFLDRLHARPLGWTGRVLAPTIRRTFSDEALHALLAGLTDADWLTRDELRASDRPIRVIWGRQDRILPSAALAFWRENLPSHAEVEEPERFGHSPQLDSARGTAEDIVGFARRLRQNEQR